MATIFEWLELHALDEEDVIRTLAYPDCAVLNPTRGNVRCGQGPIAGTDWSNFHVFLTKAVVPALEASIDCSSISDLLGSVSWLVQPKPSGQPPHTIDHGDDTPPEVLLDWDGSPESQICLAHEAGHALQLMLSGGDFMPPVAREVCAFLAELALISWADVNVPALGVDLREVWNSENNLYLGRDQAQLHAALADPAAQYHYRLNYPLARIAAILIWRTGAELQHLFKSGLDAMSLLPIDKIADIAGLSQNYLPPLPLPDADKPAIDAYRALGAMALLDIDFWKGQSEQRIEDYYSTLLHHFQNRTAFVALDEVRRPVGYAIWRKAEGEDTVTLMRQAAPFGDHLLLQKALERHLGQKSDVQAQHPRSARQEQRAW